MYQLIRFPPDALADVRALAQLSTNQLQTLATMLDTKEAAPPVDQDFEDLVAETVGLRAESAEAVVRISLILQGMNLNKDAPAKIVEDFEHLIQLQAPDDQADLLRMVRDKREDLINVVRRKSAITRELQRRQISSGTQPAIESIRTVVQLRPLFERNEKGEPVDIECLIPAMTLEIKYEREDREHSATFSLTEDTLDKLIGSLEDARSKWAVLNRKYSDQICE